MFSGVEEIRRMVADILGIPEDCVSDELAAGSIPEWDSLAQLAIVSTLEEKYKLHIPEEQLMRLSSVAAIEEYVTRGELLTKAASEANGKALMPMAEAVPIAGTEDMLLPEMIRLHARQKPGQVALVVDERSISYEELWDNMLRAAAWLQERGMKTGDVLGLYAEKRREFFALYFGAQLMGVIVLNMDPGIKQARYEAIMRQVQPKLSVGTTMFADVPWEAVQLSSSGVQSALPTLSRDDVAEIMFTTGTTGTPKGVQLTHGNLAASAVHINTFLQTTGQDVDLVALPVHHSFGMGRVRCMLAAGGVAVMAPGFSNTMKVCEMLRHYGVTGLALVPAAWAYIESSGGGKALAAAARLRYMEIGGATLLPPARDRLLELFPNTRICVYYGLTEASRSTFVELHSDTTHRDSVGRPCAGVEVRVCDEHSIPLPPGQEGEICIRGPHVMKGYLHTPREKVFYGDFFRSGDRGKINVEGYVYLSGRMKDMINVGSEKVSPEEVEAVLSCVPGVAESACVPASDPQGILGEVVKAILVADSAVPRPTDEQIQTAVSAQLERFKVPRIIEWREKLARTDSGKLQRRFMK